MTLGLGIDLVDVEELRTLSQRQPGKYLQRIFTPRELEFAESHADPLQCLAGKLAAKEACMKSLRSGWTDEIDWLSIEILTDAEGTPYVDLHDKAADRLASLSGKAILVSISHLPQIASAIALVKG